MIGDVVTLAVPALDVGFEGITGLRSFDINYLGTVYFLVMPFQYHSKNLLQLEQSSCDPADLLSL